MSAAIAAQQRIVDDVFKGAGAAVDGDEEAAVAAVRRLAAVARAGVAVEQDPSPHP